MSRYRVRILDADSERSWYVTDSFGLALSPDRAARFKRDIALAVADMFEIAERRWRASLEL